MNLLEKFLDDNKVNLGQQVLLLAISGGVDSVVLCDLCQKAGASFFIAHCNFQLRAEESVRDEAFVIQLANTYGKEILVKRFDTEGYANEQKVSIQVAARNLRYAWFKEIAATKMLELNRETRNVRLETTNEQPETSNKKRVTTNDQRASSNVLITTAHHADDNIETVVMNFFRGTGLKGLTGMGSLSRNVYRPLLSYRKEEILEYAKENNLAYVEDSSNANSYYTRNYFRNEMLPAISKVYVGVEENILKNIQRLSETAVIYDAAIGEYKRKLIEINGTEEHIPILKLKKLPSYRTILWEIISVKNYKAAQVDEIIKLMDADNGSYIESTTHRIIKNRRWLIVTNKQSENAENHVVIENDASKIKFENKLLLIDNISASHYAISGDTNIAAFDASTIQFPLLLRKYKQGDYFYPLGMKKKKKVSKFFIDQKLSKTEKEKAWVMEMNKKIVWVVGHRMDDRFKITPSTKIVLKISLETK